MPQRRVPTRRLVARPTVLNVPPMIWCNVSGIDAERVDRVDVLQHPLDLRPAERQQQNGRSWTDEGQGRARLASLHGLQNVDPRQHRAVVVRRPADKCKDAAGSQRDHPAIVIERSSCRVRPKRMGFSILPCSQSQLDGRQLAHRTTSRFDGVCMTLSVLHEPARAASEISEDLQREEPAEHSRVGCGRDPLDKIRRILQLGKLEDRKDPPSQRLNTDFGPR